MISASLPFGAGRNATVAVFTGVSAHEKRGERQRERRRERKSQMAV